jgi:DNA-binding CsgD family transcriptional regulator
VKGVGFGENGDSIPAEAVRTVLQSIERCGYDAAPFLDELSIDARELVVPWARVPWEDLGRVVEGFGRSYGQAELNRVARDAATALPKLRQLGALLLAPKTFYWVLLEVAARSPVWVLRSEEAGLTVNISLEVKKGLRCSSLLLEALAEFLAATPRLLNLEDTRVEVRSLHSHAARYVLSLPRGKTLHVRVSDAQLAATVAELTRDGVHHRVGVPTLAHLEKHFGLTRAEGRVVRRLVAGRSLNDIAKELGVGAETVRTHAKRSMQKTDTHRQAELVALVLRLGVQPDPPGEISDGEG